MYSNLKANYNYHYFFILQEVVRMIPELIKNVLDAVVSMKRIEKFLLAEEIESSIIKTSQWNKKDPNAITI